MHRLYILGHRHRGQRYRHLSEGFASVGKPGQPLHQILARSRLPLCLDLEAAKEFCKRLQRLRDGVYEIAEFLARDRYGIANP